jgi:hypothetical protein
VELFTHPLLYLDQHRHRARAPANDIGDREE